jgi:CSLREA domain-containing protein
MRRVVARRVGALIVALGLVGSLAVAPALGASIVVNSLADIAPANDGICTLHEATTAANTDTASGAAAGECGAGSGADAITFSVSGSITLASALPAVTTDLSIAGAGAVTVSGASAYRVFDIGAGTVTLSGLTITAGFAVGGGGGIWNNGGTLTVANSTISGNTTIANGGGGIFNEGGTLTVTNSTISGNTAIFSGGGGITNTGTATITNTTISENTASFGGGIANAGTATITNATISENTASFGGGIANAGTATITNATISGNVVSPGNGGGIDSTGTLTITNTTISANTASFFGARGGGILADGTEAVMNAIVAGNTAPIGPDIQGVADTITTSVIGVPGGKTLADILVPAGLADNGGPTQTIALALVAGNPAIDLGTAAVCAAVPVNALDQRGLPRPAACDIGAYEAQPPTVAAQPNASVAATSASGAVVTYSLPAGTDEQGGAAGVACLPASGSTFAVGSTTVTCTATDAVGHTGTRIFQVLVSAFVAATATPSPTPTLNPTPTPNPATIPDAAKPPGTTGTPGLALVLAAIGLLSLTTLWHREVARRRRS